MRSFITTDDPAPPPHWGQHSHFNEDRQPTVLTPLVSEPRRSLIFPASSLMSFLLDMPNLTPWVSISHVSHVCEYLASPVLCWPALLPLIGMLWCCAPGDVASSSRHWLMALGLPQVAQCMCLLIEKSTIRILMFPGHLLGGLNLELVHRWCFQRATKHKAENSNYCSWNMQTMTYFLLLLNWKVNIGAGLCQDSGHTYIKRLTCCSLHLRGRLLCTVQSSVLSTWQG